MTIKDRVFKNAARYLGYRLYALDADMLALMERAYQQMLDAARPRYTLRRYPVKEDGAVFQLADIAPIQSRDLCRLFERATEGYALLATLGAPLDMLVKRLMLTDPALGAAVGACASAYIDEYIDGFCAEEETRIAPQGEEFSPRFSPGYGDVPLSYQPPLLELLEARRLGVSLTEGNLMLPEKSVSALLAVRKTNLCDKGDTLHGCAACSMSNCDYREE